ncbi:MAG: alpha/beta hydrolase [Mycobacteriaceae bacterium]
MTTRAPIELTVSDGTVLRGEYLTPDVEPPWPVVVMSHGFGVVRTMALPAFADVIAEAGIAVLSYDHRNLGASDGVPRQEIDPYAQLGDARDVISLAQSLPGVDAARLGIWGTSYSGGHVLVLAATDARVRAVVSQVPTISGSTNASRRATADALDLARVGFATDRAARLAGAAPTLVVGTPDVTAADLDHTDDDLERTALGNDLRAWLRATPPGDLDGFVNELTLRSHELYATYEPGSYVSRIAPTPLLVVCADHDTATPTDEILRAYGEAHEPKQLVLLPGGHCDVYGPQRARAAAAARDFFGTHLGPV